MPTVPGLNGNLLPNKPGTVAIKYFRRKDMEEFVVKKEESNKRIDLLKEKIK